MKITFPLIVNSLAIAIALSSPLLLTECSNSAKTSTDLEIEEHSSQDSTEQQGVCPMHPDVTGLVGATCPKCGMKLEAVSDEMAVSTSEYYMDFQAVPEVRAGAASKLSFMPSIKGKTGSVPLDLQHDKKIHLIIVSKDLLYFDHVHPEQQADGSYLVRVLAKGVPYSEGAFKGETKFVHGGEYVLFADYLPTGSNHKVERIELTVPGEALKGQKSNSEKLVSGTEGFEVSLVTEGGKFFNEGSTHMAAIIKKNGVEIPADQLEDFLAAKAHMVMISEDSKNYLHVHPEVAKGRLSLHTTFGIPGTFRGWLQFKTNGQVRTADFVVKVMEGKAAQHGKETHKH